VRLNGLVLAAGLSSRMGAFKPLMRIGEKTLIEHSVVSLLHCAGSVTVVLGCRAGDVRAVLSGAFPPERVNFALNPAYETTDMLFSVKAGIPKVADCDAFFLLPGDMPAVDAGTLAALAAALANTAAAVAIPIMEGRRKHPPLIRACCRKDILSYDGEGGLRAIWRGYGDRVAEVPVDDRGCLLDADTMDDFFALSNYLQHKQRSACTAPDLPEDMNG